MIDEFLAHALDECDRIVVVEENGKLFVDLSVRIAGNFLPIEATYVKGVNEVVVIRLHVIYYYTAAIGEKRAIHSFYSPKF